MINKKELKSFSIIKHIEKQFPAIGENSLFYNVDGGFSGLNDIINLYETSFNLCFRFEYKPTGFENVYHDLFIEDWTTGKRYKCGYVYFKTYSGYITPESMQELFRITSAATKILENVFRLIA